MILLAIPITAASLVVAMWLISRLVTSTVEGVTRMMGQVVGELLHPSPDEPVAEEEETAQERMLRPAWSEWPVAEHES